MVKVFIYKNGEVTETILRASTTLRTIAEQNNLNPMINPIYVNGDVERDLETTIGSYGLETLNITSVFKVTNG